MKTFFLFWSFVKTIIAYILIGFVFFLALPLLLWSFLPERYRFKSRFFFILVSIFYRLLLRASLVRVSSVKLTTPLKDVTKLSFESNARTVVVMLCPAT